MNKRPIVIKTAFDFPNLFSINAIFIGCEFGEEGRGNNEHVLLSEIPYILLNKQIISFQS